MSLRGVLCLRSIVGRGYENREELSFLENAPQRCQAGQSSQETDPCQAMVDAAKRNNTLLRASDYQSCLSRQQSSGQEQKSIDYSNTEPMEDSETQDEDASGIQPTQITPTEVTSTKISPSDTSKAQDSFATIAERCKKSGIPSSYFGACCAPPDYWLNALCPYQMKGQKLEWKSGKEGDAQGRSQDVAPPISATEIKQNQSLFGGMSSQAEPSLLANRIKELSDNASKLSAGELLDVSGKKLDEGSIVAAGGLSENVPAATMQFAIKDAQRGQAIEAIVSGKASGYLPIDKVVAIPDENVQDATMVVSVGLGSKPELLGGGAMGQPDFPIPDPDLYQTLNYFKVDVFHGKIPPGGITSESREVSYKEVLLSMVVAAKDLVDPRANYEYSDPASASVTVLHWNKNIQKYEELPAEKGLCAQDYRWCRYTVKASSFSPFAIVLKKPRTSPLMWLLLFIWLGAVIFMQIKFWRPVKLQLKQAKTTPESWLALKKLGFWKYVLLAGILLFGNYLALMLSFLIAASYLSLAMLGMFFMGGLSWGFVFGCLTWFSSYLKYRFKRA